jgi:hypothetical protein
VSPFEQTTGTGRYLGRDQHHGSVWQVRQGAVNTFQDQLDILLVIIVDRGVVAHPLQIRAHERNGWIRLEG